MISERHDYSRAAFLFLDQRFQIQKKRVVEILISVLKLRQRRALHLYKEGNTIFFLSREPFGALVWPLGNVFIWKLYQWRSMQGIEVRIIV